ncbi:MAG: hypothetical protein M3142_07810 [Bacteroidota bacterium]|nr:hypothetical protein [Bacteroidota bacterium]
MSAINLKIRGVCFFSTNKERYTDFLEAKNVGIVPMAEVTVLFLTALAKIKIFFRIIIRIHLLPVSEYF